MISELVKRNEELRSENEELRAALELTRNESSRTERKLADSERKCEYLAYQIENLRRALFGKRSEKIPPRDDGLVQLDLFEEALEEFEAAPEELEEEREERRKRRARRKPIPKHLHREEVVVDVDEDLKVCPDCGEEMSPMGEDISEELEYIPALLYVTRYLLKKYACRKCQSGVVQAKAPPRPIPRARPGAGLLAYLLVSKYQDHLPLSRLERIFGRHGMEISRKTLCDWVQAMGELLRPIVEAQKRVLLCAPLLQADETPVRVKDPEVKGQTTRSWIWTYGIPDAEVVYDFTSGRSAECALEFLGEFTGYLQSDSYSVYKSLQKRGKTIHIGCWSHARRGFFEAKGEQPEFSGVTLSAIQKLFRIERQAKEAGIVGGELLELRGRESAPILEALRSLLLAKQISVLPESGTGSAIAYALKNWEALTRFLGVAEAPIHNNGSELSLRRVVTGRKNWMFIGHPAAGPRACVIFSLVETCNRLGIEPMAYLRSVIAELARDPERDAAELTPRRWLERERAATAKGAAGTDG